MDEACYRVSDGKGSRTLLMNRKLEILIVDDEKNILEVITQYIQAITPDVRITALTDPLAARSFLSQNTVDVLITDYRMPQLND